MRRKAAAMLLALALIASAGCGQAGSPDTEAPADYEPMSMEEHQELVDGPGSVEEKVDVICQDMRDSGSFDDTGVTPEEVGC